MHGKLLGAEHSPSRYNLGKKKCEIELENGVQTYLPLRDSPRTTLRSLILPGNKQCLKP